MNRSTYTITIDRLVLDGLAASPQRGERIRALVAAELQRLLTAEGLPDAPAARTIDKMAAAPLSLPSTPSDQHLAAGIARQVVHGLRSSTMQRG